MVMKLATPLLLAFAGWFGTLQSVPAAGASADLLRIASVAGLLSTLTVFVYRLGVWRQEMENTKNNIGAEVKAYHDACCANFDRLDRRLEAIDHMVTSVARSAVRATRWQVRTERRLDSLEEERTGEAQETARAPISP